jgi:hypothetical protein
MSNVLARSLLLIAVALAAAIGCWFVFQREAPPTIAVDRSTAAPQLAETRPAQQSAPVDPALASPSTPHVADVADTNGDASRSAVGGSLEGRTWSDLIVAVDRTSGAPIDGAHLALIDADGELRRPRSTRTCLRPIFRAASSSHSTHRHTCRASSSRSISRTTRVRRERWRSIPAAR